jgi:hypothetical protein
MNMDLKVFEKLDSDGEIPQFKTQRATTQE